MLTLCCCHPPPPRPRPPFPKHTEDIDSGPSSSTSMLSEAARAHNITLVGGSVPERSNGKLYNTCCVYDNTGKLLAKHRYACQGHGPGCARLAGAVEELVLPSMQQAHACVGDQKLHRLVGVCTKLLQAIQAPRTCQSGHAGRACLHPIRAHLHLHLHLLLCAGRCTCLTSTFPGR
jgi:hypothetical protein